DSIACLARDPRKEGIELIIDVPDVLVSISEQALQQVLVNLLLNAKTAMARKGGQLRITARIEDAQVHIDVADTGPGIPPQIADRLFEPFVMHGCGEQGGSAQRKGTGLGLSICRDLIRTAGGSIHATSAPG